MTNPKATATVETIGARVIHRRDAPRPWDLRRRGTVVHVWPAVEHEHDTYVLVAWDELPPVGTDTVMDPDELVIES